MNIGDEVCVLGLDGIILNGYKFTKLKSHIATVECDGKELNINSNRMLPLEAKGKASVASTSYSTSDKYSAVCPFCGYIKCVEPSDTEVMFDCHGTLELYWITRIVSKAKKPKVTKMKQIPTVIDLEHLKTIGELWTKSQVKFDDPNTDVKAHVLILTTSEPPRKLCFNTYNGTLGKKGGTLPIDEFVKGEALIKSAWYNIKNLDDARKTLETNGFTKQN